MRAWLAVLAVLILSLVWAAWHGGAAREQPAIAPRHDEAAHEEHAAVELQVEPVAARQGSLLDRPSRPAAPAAVAQVRDAQPGGACEIRGRFEFRGGAPAAGVSLWVDATP